MCIFFNEQVKSFPVMPIINVASAHFQLALVSHGIYSALLVNEKGELSMSSTFILKVQWAAN